MLLVFFLLPAAALAQNYRFGFNPKTRVHHDYVKYHVLDKNDTIPTAVDWRKEGYVTEVKNQENCGSCYIFSAIGAIEGQWKRIHGVLTSLSEQNVLDCDVNGPDGGCDGGGFMNNVFDFVKKEGGVDTETSYKYLGQQENKCYYNASGRAATVTGYTQVNPTDEDVLHALATVGPISIGIDAETFGYYQGGIFDGRNCSSDPDEADHGVLLVGYGVEDNQPFWIVKNSWGQKFGESGYIRLSRDVPNICGIANYASYPNVGSPRN